MTRVLSGAVLLLLATAVVWFAPPLLFLAAAEALLLLAFAEYAGLARASGTPVSVWTAAAAAACTCAAFAQVLPGKPVSAQVVVVLMAAFLVLSTIAMAKWRGGRDALGSLAAGLFPAVYLGLPIGAMVAIRGRRGPEVLFLLMLTVFASDTAQYYTGRALGSRPLATAISPKKTVEGAIGGFVFGGVLLAAAGVWWLPTVPPVVRAALGVAVVAFGIVGDLFESMLKRSAGMKDSSSMIPGHGGVLDRIDALLFAAPVYYIALEYL